MTTSHPLEITHQTLTAAGTEVHVASAGHGSPVLLVHGFPETWWTFHKLFPYLSEHHQILAVDLPGFGDSAIVEDFGSEQMAATLAGVIDELGIGPVHLTGQDISGPLTYRLAATHPEFVVSYTAIETVLPGFGWEALADVAHGGAWHIGLLAAPGIPELLLTGRERSFLGEYAFPAMLGTPEALSDDDLEEFTRSYSRAGGFRGASGLYRSLIDEGPDIQALATSPLPMPVLTVSGSAGEFTPTSLRNVAPHLEHVALRDIGHYVALEAPERLADTLLPFFSAAEHSRDHR
jgi:pimeloyl-ACP methyl ester carboxylesterase